MPKYSLLFFDSGETIRVSARVHCLTDEEAVRVAAKEARNYGAVEVWEGDRPISAAPGSL
jgi:hypothetical protein